MTAATVIRERQPYRGLVPFEKEDEKYFVGREREIEAIFAVLVCGPPHHRLRDQRRR